MSKRLFGGNLLICGLLLADCGSSGASPAGGAAGSSSAGSGGAGSGGTTPIATGGSNAGSSSSGGSGAETTGGGAGAPGGGGSGGGGAPMTDGIPDGATVVLFLIDGLHAAALDTAVSSGAANMKFLIDNGVRAETVYSTSPAARLQLPDSSQPWGNATSGNVAPHTGCHLNESSMMDDIFVAARAAGIKSVFSGGDPNYAIFTTPDFHYADDTSDEQTVAQAIDHVQSDDARLVRIHLQRIRDFWNGPASSTAASGDYVQHLLEIDGLFGTLRAALETKGVWDKTYVVLSSDHGMGDSASSDHPPNVRSSWETVMVFYGPGIKQGATIPYAESPDVALLTNHWLKLPALRGHDDAAVTLAIEGPTGTLLTNIFEGESAELSHPRYIEAYLNTNTYMAGGTGYADYRQGMLALLK